MALASEVTICNQALGWVGGALITSLNDTSNEAKLCKVNYAPLRDAVLEEADWTFAQARWYLTPTVKKPAWGYQNQFLIPGDMIRVIYCGLSDRLEEDDPADWQREGQHIVSNASALYVRSLLRQKDTTFFSTLFVQGLAARIAMDLAIPIANSRSLQADMGKMYARKIGEAMAQDAKQGKTRTLKAPGMQQSRRAGATNSYIGPYV